MKGFVVGLTGGIGSGKSSALAEFARLGARTLALDDVSREVMRPGRPGHARVVKAFGPIDRAALGRRVFSNRADLRLLERLIHPFILAGMRRSLRALRAKGALAVVDVPLLFEKGLAKDFDATVLVTAGRRARMERVRRRDKLGAAAVAKRMAAQWDDRAKRKLADVVIANDGTRRDLSKKVGEYFRSFELIHSGGR